MSFTDHCASPEHTGPSPVNLMGTHLHAEPRLYVRGGLLMDFLWHAEPGSISACPSERPSQRLSMNCPLSAQGRLSR